MDSGWCFGECAVVDAGGCMVSRWMWMPMPHGMPPQHYRTPRPARAATYRTSLEAKALDS